MYRQPLQIYIKLPISAIWCEVISERRIHSKKPKYPQYSLLEFIRPPRTCMAPVDITPLPWTPTPTCPRHIGGLLVPKYFKSLLASWHSLLSPNATTKHTASSLFFRSQRKYPLVSACCFFLSLYLIQFVNVLLPWTVSSVRAVAVTVSILFRAAPPLLNCASVLAQCLMWGAT